MSFDALSNELIDEICGHLTSLPNRDLSNLSRCSRRLHSSVIPLLYSTIYQAKHRVVPCFLRTIRVKPKLANYVRCFEGHSLVEGFKHDDQSAYPLFFPGEEEVTRQWVRSVLQEAILDSILSDMWYSRIFSPMNWDDDYGDAESEYWDAVVALLLLLLPQLKYIRMVSYGNLSGYPCIDSVLLQLQLSQIKFRPQEPCLGPLREVDLNSSGSWPGLGLDEALLYLAVPSVTEFRGRRIRIKGSLEPFQTQVFHTTTVILAESQLGPMGSFLSCFHSLKRFEYEYARLKIGDEVFSPSSVNEGLTNSEHCLEELVLYNNNRYWGERDSPDDLHPLGSLARFVKLR
jgi:hypothetical protein